MAIFGKILPVAITVILSLIKTVFTWPLQDLPPREQIYGLSGVPAQYASAGPDIELRNLGTAAEFLEFLQKKDFCCLWHLL